MEMQKEYFDELTKLNQKDILEETQDKEIDKHIANNWVRSQWGYSVPNWN